MLRIIAIRDAKAAGAYYARSDGGYYMDGVELRREFGGRGTVLLGLFGPPKEEHFLRLMNGLDPRTGEQLTAKLGENRLAGWDFNLHCPKSVTVAIERGDQRVHAAFWSAANETMAEVESRVLTRVRKGRAQEDRVTGNMVWYAVEHAETRPNRDDGMPDPHRHIHFVVANITFDETEAVWKAAKVRRIMELRRYFDRRFAMRLADKMTELGYDVETKWRQERGRRKYVGWDLKGIPRSVLEKFSRRTAEVERTASRLGIEDPVAKDRLGAASRGRKRDDLALEEYRRYWESRIEPSEAEAIGATIGEAMSRRGRRRESGVVEAVAYAIEHEFERASVVPADRVEIGAMERCMGAGMPDEILPEALRQGLLVKDDDATTAEVLAEERRMLGFAVSGRAACRPLMSAEAAGRAIAGLEGVGSVVLSGEQRNLIRHVLTSPDRVMLLVGDAGTGKTTATKHLVPLVEAAGRRVVVLAPSADASRGVLRGEGFADAETVASFLLKPALQERARGGIILVDEAGFGGTRTTAALFATAERVGARVILMGDKKQMKPVGRGHPLRVLEEVGGLPAARLSKTHRFRNRDHAAAVAEMAHSRPEKGFDALDRLGYIREIERDDYGPVAAEYARAIKEGKSALIACPTHSEGRKIATAVRERLRAEGLIGKEEQVLPRLVPTQWTEAERADSENYESGMVAHFFRARGRTRAGEKVPVIAENASELASAAAKHQVYRRDVLPVAAGDKLRVTRNGKTRDGEHAVNNGEIVTVRGFTAEGDVIDERGWVIGRNFEHLAHGYVVTAIPSQGKTVDRPIGVATQESYPAVRDDWQYVTASRGREPILLFTDDKRRLRQLVARADKRLSAVELLGQSKRRSLAARARARIARMRRRGMLAMRLAARSVAAGLAAREWRHEARSAYR